MFFIFFVKTFTLVQMTHTGTIERDPLGQFPANHSHSDQPCLHSELCVGVSTGWCIDRRDSLITAFRMDPAASGRGLCDIDRAFFKIPKSRVKKWEVHVRQKYTNNLIISILIIIGILAGTSQFFDM